MKPGEVRIPRRMENLPRDPRGYPIPVIVFRDEAGRPHFTVNNESARAMSIHDDTCSICGVTLMRVRWFVGGPMCAFHDRGAYADTPMHRDCLRYALQVCPYLAAPHYGKRIEDKTYTGKRDPHRLMFDTTQDPDRPVLFVAVGSTETLTAGDRHEQLLSPYVRPARPYSAVEFWQSGRQISAAIALQQLPAQLRANARRLMP